MRLWIHWIGLLDLAIRCQEPTDVDRAYGTTRIRCMSTLQRLEELGREQSLLRPGGSAGPAFAPSGAEHRFGVGHSAESIERLRNWGSGQCLGAVRPGIFRRNSGSGRTLAATSRVIHRSIDAKRD